MKINRFESFVSEGESKVYTVDTANSAPDDVKKSLWAADTVQYGSGTAVASIQYKYVPAELSSTGNPLFCTWGMSFDGGKKAKQESPEKSWTWEEIKEFFPDNKFEN